MVSLGTTIMAGLGLTALDRLTAPKAPSARPLPPFDFSKETGEALAARRKLQDPRQQQLTARLRENAAMFLRGELPAEVKQTIKRTVAQASTARGLSAGQTARLTARELGMNQLALMERGAQLVQTLDTIRNNEWAVASDSALSKANRLFEAYTISENARLAGYAVRAKQHASLFKNLGTALFAAPSSLIPSTPPGHSKPTQSRITQGS